MQMKEQVLQQATQEHQHFIESQHAALDSVMNRLQHLRAVTAESTPADT